MNKTTINMSIGELKRIEDIKKYLGLRSRIAVLNYLTKDFCRKIKREKAKEILK